MSAFAALAEVALGQRAPGFLASNVEVKTRGLAAINAYRTDHGHRPLAELPKGHPDMTYSTCLLGACTSDMPRQEYHAMKLSEHPYVGQLEVRFERHQLPELIADAYERPTLVYRRPPDAHDHALAR